jgi:hypothetical protein
MEDFTITGWFYSIREFEFRKYLNIKRKGYNLDSPDIIFIMMNPGGSSPVDVLNVEIETETIPDNTQSQIIKVMNSCSFNYARILNLSDYREEESSKFYTKIIEFENLKISHSIFSDNRRKDFDELFIRNVPIIVGWGVNKKLAILAKKAISLLGKNLQGYKKEKCDFGYFHPYPRYDAKRMKTNWPIEICRQLNQS